MKILALDFGEKRIGVAVSDPLGIVAQGLTVIKRSNLPADLSAIRTLVCEEEVGHILVGHPLNMDGTEGPMAKKVQGFVDRLAAFLGDASPPIELLDERLSTEVAEGILMERGVGWKQRKQVVDQVAAAVILQEYLDTRDGGALLPEPEEG